MTARAEAAPIPTDQPFGTLHDMFLNVWKCICVFWHSVFPPDGDFCSSDECCTLPENLGNVKDFTLK